MATGELERDDQGEVRNDGGSAAAAPIEPRGDLPPIRKFRPDIEGLRASAVAVVIAYHAGVPGFSGGFVGVDVFFVISGFLITRLLVDEARRTHAVSLVRFYARRFRRILPAATVVFMAVLLVTRFRTNPFERASFATDGRATALFGMNVRGTLANNDYLAQASVESPFLHYWSLALEEQFYAVWPLLILIAVRLRRGTDPLRRITVVIGTVFVASLGLSAWLTSRSPVWSFYLLPTRAWELAAGGLVAVSLEQLRRLPKAFGPLLGWAGLAAIAIASHWFTGFMAFPGWIATLPVFGTVAVLVAGCTEAAYGPEWILKRRPFQIVGLLSFSLYLWHWPLLVALDGHNWTFKLAVVMVLLAFLAPATYWIVEKPIRGSGWLTPRPFVSVAMGFSLAAVMFVAVPVALPPAVLSTGRASIGPSATISADGVRVPTGIPPVIDYVPSNLDPPLRQVSSVQNQLNTHGCLLSIARSTPKLPCRFGDTASPDLVVLMGDSHAAQWFPALLDIANRRHWDLEVQAKVNCPAGTITVTRRGQSYPGCGRWRTSELALLRRQRPRLVVISDSTYATVDGLDVTSPQGLAAAAAGLRTTIAALPGTTAVAVLGPSPTEPTDIPFCLASDQAAIHACIGPRSTVVDQPLIDAEAPAVAASGGTFVDTAPLVCFHDPCPAIAWNLLIYSDEDHLLPDFTRSLEPQIEPRLVTALDSGGHH